MIHFITHVADSFQEANDFIEKKNRSTRSRHRQKENLNLLNTRCVKLESDIELKTRSIRELLNNAGTISLGDNEIAPDSLISVNVNRMAMADNEHIYGAAVLFCDGLNKDVIIKVSWIRDFMKADLLNNGLKSTTKYVVYYSDKIVANADFNLLIVSKYSEQSALYVSNIYKFFGKQIRLKDFVLTIILY